MTEALILAAGRGARLRPLTDRIPKPLIEVAGRCLIEHQIFALREAGICELVVNLSWLGDKICARLGDGRKYGVAIRYSDEGDSALETAGGIIKALPLLRSDPFIVCNADVWCDIDYSSLTLSENYLAHLVLVENPPHHPQGDFSLNNGVLTARSNLTHTFSGIGMYRKKMFAGLPEGKRPLAPLLNQGIDTNSISAELYQGVWFDIGTSRRLDALNSFVAGN